MTYWGEIPAALKPGCESQSASSVVRDYFRSFYVWVPLQLFFPRHLIVYGSFPFPGGLTLGSLLMVNLLAAHAIRFKFTLKRSGIILLHAGVVVMMLGELVTGLFAVESRMTIALNETVGFTDVNSPPMFGGSARELALIDSAMDLRNFKRDLRQSEIYYHLAPGLGHL